MYTYRPKKTYLTKLLLSTTFLFLLAYTSLFLFLFFILRDENVVNYLWKAIWITGAVNLAWALPVFLLSFPVFKNYRYELLDDEIVVYSGFLIKKIRHVPYRMVTNLELRRGILDRLLGIGTLKIETAGNSDPNQRPEAMLVGLEDVDGVYEEVASCLRNFDQAQQRHPWERGAKGTPSEEESVVLGEILIELKAIRQKIN